MPAGGRLTVVETELRAVEALRAEYQREMGCQIVHDSWHRRGFSTMYAVRADDELIGYAAVGGPPGTPREILKELYLIPPARGRTRVVAGRVIAASGARFIEAQTNDVQLSLVLWDCATECSSETILFADGTDSRIECPDVRLRALSAADRADVFPHSLEPVGDWGVEYDDAIVATGGFLTHYNPPFVDLYIEVAAPFRGRGCGSYLVQALRGIARAAGHVPAARCHADNLASRSALQRGGMRPCARVVRGRLLIA